MSEPKIVNISGHARPRHVMDRHIAGHHQAAANAHLSATIDHAVAVDALAKILKETVDAAMHPDGRVDWREVAERLFAKMHGGAP